MSTPYYIQEQTNLPTVLFTGDVINLVQSAVYVPSLLLKEYSLDIVQSYIPFYSSNNGKIYLITQGSYGKISNIYDCLSKISNPLSDTSLDSEVKCCWKISSIVSFTHQYDLWGIYVPDIEPFTPNIPFIGSGIKYQHKITLYNIGLKNKLLEQYNKIKIYSFNKLPQLSLESSVSSSVYFTSNNSNRIVLTPSEIDKVSKNGIEALAIYSIVGTVISPVLTVTVEELSCADNVMICSYYPYLHCKATEQNVLYSLCKVVGQGDTVKLFSYYDAYRQNFAFSNEREPPSDRFIIYRDPTQSVLLLPFCISIYPKPKFKNGRIVLRLDFSYLDNMLVQRTISNKLIIEFTGFHKPSTSPIVYRRQVMKIDRSSISIRKISNNGYTVRFCAIAKTPVDNPFIGVKYVDGKSSEIVINGITVEKGGMVSYPYWKSLPQGQEVCANFTIALDGIGDYTVELVTGYISKGRTYITDRYGITLKVVPPPSPTYIPPPSRQSLSISEVAPYLALGLGGLVFTIGLAKYLKKSRK